MPRRHGRLNDVLALRRPRTYAGRLAPLTRDPSPAVRIHNAPVEEIARKLKVAHVLEGSVRRSGARLRISAQLVSAADGYQLWSRGRFHWCTGTLTAVEQALALFHEAIARDSSCLAAGSLMPELNVMLEFESLHGHPRCRVLLRRLSLETGRGEIP